MSQITPIIYLFLSALQFIILLRFICQAMDVSYYNPVTQTVVKLSNYFLIPFNMLGLKANTYILTNTIIPLHIYKIICTSHD